MSPRAKKQSVQVAVSHAAIQYATKADWAIVHAAAKIAGMSLWAYVIDRAVKSARKDLKDAYVQ